MKKQSVDILDDAERFEDVLNWQLFKIEQDQMLWGARMEYPEDWYPGFPMYKRPASILGAALNGGQWIRPMFQLFDGNASLETQDYREFDLNRLCETCCVKWEGPAGCWVCGEGEIEYEEPIQKPMTVFTDYDIDRSEYVLHIDFEDAVFREALHSMRDAMSRAFIEVRTGLESFQRTIAQSFRSGLNDYIVEALDTRSPEDILVNGIRIPRHVVLDAVAEPPLPEPPFPPFQPIRGDSAFWTIGLDQNRRRNRD
jgi:hypothetical protein